MSDSEMNLCGEINQISPGASPALFTQLALKLKQAGLSTCRCINALNAKRIEDTKPAIEKEWGISEEQRKAIPKLPDKKFIIQENPFNTEDKLLLMPTPQLDCSVIHVQMASPDGTCRILGDVYQDVDIAFAAKRTIVTCEAISERRMAS